MFFILATKPLNDGTRGFRFNVFGQKGLVRIRKRKSKPIALDRKPCMTRLDCKKVSVYFEHTETNRALHHFAG